MNKRILIPALLCFLCVTSFAQRGSSKKAAQGNTIFSESFDAEMLPLEWPLVKYVQVTMSVTQSPTDEDVDKALLGWRCVVVDKENGRTLMDFEDHGTLDCDYKKEGHFHVVSSGSSKYRLVVDMNDPSFFTILEIGTDGPKSTWVLETSTSEKGTQWIDRYLCWALYTNFRFVNRLLEDGLKEEFYENRIAFMRDIVSNYPNGVLEDRDKSFVTPRLLVDRLKDRIEPSAFTRSVTQQERESTTNRSSQIDDQTKVKNLKNLLARFFQRMVDNKSRKEISVMREFLKGHQDMPFQSFEYLRKGPGSGRDYTILEMLQHPCLLLPTFNDGLSMKEALKQISEAFPYKKMPRRISNKDWLKLNRRDIEMADCPRVEGNEVYQMELARVTKSAWIYDYWFTFRTEEKAQAFFYDICAELAYEGFSIIKDKDVSFSFEKKIHDGKKTLIQDFTVSMTHYGATGDWHVWIKGHNTHF